MQSFVNIMTIKFIKLTFILKIFRYFWASLYIKKNIGNYVKIFIEQYNNF